MSYDLMVFDQAVAPRNRDNFIRWYEDVTKWDDPRDYFSPHGMTGNLGAFYDSLRQTFPPMNGPHAISEAQVDDPEVTDYMLAESAIYMAFAWSVSGTARQSVIQNAISANVGFFDVSSPSGVIAHDRSVLMKLEF